MNEFKFLYKIHCDKKFLSRGGIERKYELRRFPIVQETKFSYFVPKYFKMSKEECEKLIKANDNKYTEYCYMIKKDTMKSKVESEQYFTEPFLAKESFFISRNAERIGRELSHSKNAYLLRQIAHNLELDDLEELEYNFEDE